MKAESSGLTLGARSVPKHWFHRFPRIEAVVKIKLVIMTG